MKIHIEENMYLESDEYQFMINRYSEAVDNRSGRKRYKTLGFYPNISSAINHLVKMKLTQSNATTLKELREEVRGLREWASNLFEGVHE